VKVVEVVDGSCGYSTRIAVHSKDADRVAITVFSECDAAAEWGKEISRVDWKECLGSRPLESHLWQSALETLRHRSCPVLTGVLRAIEAEVGATKPAKIMIRFLAGENSDRRKECPAGDENPPSKNE
jgi:hypothetical protein